MAAEGEPCRAGDRTYTSYPYKSTYPDGGKHIDGGYCGPERHGAWTEWYKNGLMKAQGAYAGGLEDGPWRTWFENGQIKESGSYIQGKKEGVWEVYTEKGELIESLTYHQGMPVGKYEYRHPRSSDAVVRAEFPDGDYKAVFSYGGEVDGGLKNGRPHGPWLIRMARFSPTWKGTFDEGKKTGRWTATLEDRCVWAEGEYVDDAREGEWTFRGWKDQKRRQCVTKAIGQYVHGKRHGPWRFEYDGPCHDQDWWQTEDDRTIQFFQNMAGTDEGCHYILEETFADDELHGPLRVTQKDGSVVREGEYRHGRKAGKWQGWLTASKKFIGRMRLR
ncbi:MAG: hypothetical protein M5R36_15770 [Deltaproteobacteria bacterium]|nr:hypothetical protein [Deltaproteobacteria bacterium]